MPIIKKLAGKSRVSEITVLVKARAVPHRSYCQSVCLRAIDREFVQIPTIG